MSVPRATVVLSFTCAAWFACALRADEIEFTKTQIDKNFRSEGVAVMERIRWPRSIGIAGQNPSD